MTDSIIDQRVRTLVPLHAYLNDKIEIPVSSFGTVIETLINEEGIECALVHFEAHDDHAHVLVADLEPFTGRPTRRCMISSKSTPHRRLTRPS